VVPQSSNLDWALYYAAIGWQVFPLHTIIDVDQCSCRNSACVSRGKHPRTEHGLKDATDDEDQVREWWEKWPEANIGVATGSGSRIWVLDVDLRDGGTENWIKFTLGRIVDTIEQRTGSGGAQIVFAWDSDLEVRNRQNVLPGVDVRGEGGYVVVPPSLHLSGHLYAWVEGRDPGSREASLAPPWVMELVLGEQRPSIPAAPVPSSALPDSEVLSVRSALGALDADCDREKWIRVGMALHSTGAGEQAFRLWNEWSCTGAAKYPGEPELRRQWASFARKTDEVRLSTIFWLAQDAGWSGHFEEQADGRVLAMLPGAMAGSAAGALSPAPVPTAWSEPEPLGLVRTGHIAFPAAEAYPEDLAWMREWVEALAWTMQVPVDFPATIALALVAGACGGRFVVHVPGTEWREETPIWVLSAMPSGMGKSSCIRPLRAPFDEFEHEHDSEHRDACASWEARLESASADYDNAKRDLKRKSSALDYEQRGELEAKMALAKQNIAIATEQRPQSARIVVSDLTSEALVEFLEEHRSRALVIDPEGGVFAHALGNGRDKAPRLDPWCKSYTGDPIDDGRIGNGLPGAKKGRRCRRPSLSIAVATQTKVLGAIHGNEVARSKGFLARFITVAIPPRLQEGLWREATLPEDLAQDWRASILRLLRLPEPSEPYVVRLSPEAKALFWEWGEGKLAEARADDAARDEWLSAWGSRLRGKALRIAFALHALRYESPQLYDIGGDAMRCAIVWLGYIEQHERALLHVIGDDMATGLAERVLDWLVRHGLKCFSRRQAFQALKGGEGKVQTVHDIDAALAALSDAGWIKAASKLELRRGGHSTAAKYVVHPDIRGAAERARRAADS
jgi:hypothetical protein